MGLETIERAVRGLRHTSEEEWPFAVAALARALDRELASPDALRAVAEELGEVAHRKGCDAVTGASPMGERLAAAIVATSRNGLRLLAPDQKAACVLLVDGVMATGTQLARTSRAIRSMGATRTPAAVVIADGEVLRRASDLVGEEIVSLREF
jgi:adenine/guanine phosphoribosyltransferase-like PRPP-binding protein